VVPVKKLLLLMRRNPFSYVLLMLPCAAVVVLSAFTPQAVETLVSLCGSAVVPVKKLLLWMEMARQELAEPNGPIPLEAWQKVLRDLSS
jgi:hypothetical protein